MSAHVKWYNDKAVMNSLVREIARACGIRLDSGETAVFIRQLTAIISRTFDVKYPNLRIKDFVPVSSEAGPGAEFFAWRGFDYAGMAKIIDDFATDLPMVEVLGGEVVQPIKSIGSAYNYTIQEMRASQMAGTQIETKRAVAARRIIENAIEYIGAFGNVTAGLPGFVNNSNVTLITSGITGDWLTATSAEILDDLNFIANSVPDNSKAIWTPDTLLLPPTRYNVVMTKAFSDLQPKPVGRVFLDNSPYIRNIDQWPLLETADAGGTGPRGICYLRSPEVLELMIPLEFEQLPPQQRALAFIINCHCRFGGMKITYPMGLTYVDGI